MNSPVITTRHVGMHGVGTNMGGELVDNINDVLAHYIPTVVMTVRQRGGITGMLILLVALATLFFLAALLYARLMAIPGLLHKIYQRLFDFTEREIEVTISTDWYFNFRNDTQQNQMLQRAIKVRLAQVASKARYTNAVVELIEPTALENRKACDTTSVHRSAKELRELAMTAYPRDGQFELLPETNPPVYFSFYTVVNSGSSATEKRKKTTMTLRTYARNGHEVLRKFVDECFNKYVEMVSANEETGRFLYQLQFNMSKRETGGDDDEDAADIPAPSLFKKYKLSETKTFDTLFFPQKNEILKLVEDFEKKRGKFAIQGFPQKLGLLLHGPPGTGKTTFVKALAAHMKRHIVSIPLGKITTNQELYDIMFEGLFPCVGRESKPDKLGFKDVIFLMEEIDAASDLVRARQPARTTPKEDEGEGEENKDDLSREPSGWDEVGGQPTSTSALKLMFEPADKLDLAGLLNILDGVVDSPGRVIIMTTNFPEHLDAALIRPGRINHKLLLSYMLKEDFEGMVHHHYKDDLTEASRRELSDLWDKKKKDDRFRVTPAEVEQLCAEYETLQEFLEGFSKFPDPNKDFRVLYNQ